MSEEKQDLNVESILQSARLKRPREADMSNFLSGVHKKINQRGPRIGLPEAVTGVALGLVSIGLVYFFLARSERLPLPPPTTAEAISIEENLVVLEALDIDVEDELTSFLDDDELLEELAFLDGMEVGFVGPSTGAGAEPH